MRSEAVGSWAWRDVTGRSMPELRAVATEPNLRRTVLRLRLDMAVPMAEYDEAERPVRELGGSMAAMPQVGVLLVEERQPGVVERGGAADRPRAVPAGAVRADLLKVTTCRRGDGRELSLAECPLAQQLGSAERVRAEEIVLSVPGGGRVTTLLNATPIRTADGEVDSVVVTMQDLAPIEEIDRQRAELLGLVSHECKRR